MVNQGNDELIRIEFGNDLSNVPTATSLGDLGLITSSWGVTIVRDGSEYKGVVSNSSSLILLDFGSSLTATPTANLVSVTGSSRIFNVALHKTTTGWYGLGADDSTDEIYHFSFGSEINNSATSTSIALGGLTTVDYRYSELVIEGGVFYGFVQSRFGELIRLNFGSDLSSTSPTIEDLGDIDVDVSNDIVGFSMESDSSTWYGFATSFGGSLNRFTFPNDCGVNVPVSAEESPSGISYSSAGNYTIELKAFDSDGDMSVASSSIEILNSSAPEINFTIDNNRCVTFSNSFAPSATGLTSYSWDFNNDGTEDSNQENPTFDFSTLGTGTYTVRLDVSDGTCSNFVEQSITIYPEPPAPTFTPSTTTECVNTQINFSNTTDESQHTGVISYEWDFDNDGMVDSTDPNPSFTYTTAGVKTVSVTSLIPGCESAGSTMDITINAGPTANFTATSVCQTESTQFTNTSIDGASYFWDFGDGFTSTNENPSHLFLAAGDYNVSLTTTDINGCDNTEVLVVPVSDLPQVDFDFSIPCASPDGTQFTDLSTVTNADIVGWSWRVDGIEESTSQNPELIFTEAGIRTVTLVATGSNGCEATYSEDINILERPSPNFSAVIGCQGTSTSFSDITSAEGNQIVSWRWDVNGTVYTTQNVEHVFDDPGSYEVTLEVTGQNFCTETVTQMVEVLQLPTADFIIDGSCDNVIVNALDQSDEFNDPILSRRWMLDGQNVGNGGELFLPNLTSGSYDLSLELETGSGCIITSNQMLEINSSPTASFTFDKFFGVPGDMLTFTNTSSGSSSYQWLLDDSEISTSPTSQNFIFEEAGNFEISLISSNNLGCADTIKQDVTIAIPEVDLVIGGFELVEEGSTGKIFLEIENQSNLPIDVTEAQIELENQFTVTESIELLIGIGETRLVGLDIGIPLDLSQTAYFCVTLASQYEGYSDINPVNNEKCITIEPSIVIEDPFPNPVRDEFRLKLVTPSAGQVGIRVINSAGKLEMEESFDSISGLNNYFINMT
ncbi:MAG: PKD domain-containing protein, partial [Bacteroidota bacterium]